LKGAGGELRAVVEPLEADAERLCGRYQMLVDAPEILILRRRRELGKEEPEERVLMAGEIIAPSTILEIVNLIASARWVGTLRVYGRDSLRTLGFYNGTLRHAQSNHPEDRLDKVLSRVGILSPAQVESVMREHKAGQRFGELLVEKKLVERQQLFGLLGRQMEQILLAAMLEEEGTYVFTVDEGNGSAPTALAHISLQRLLLDAAERVDKLRVFRGLIPDLEACPEVEPGVDVASLSAPERMVLGYSDGSRGIREIASETWLGLFQTLETLYALLRRGQVRMVPPERGPVEMAEGLVAPFNRSLEEIFEAIEVHRHERGGDLGRIHQELREWVQNHEEASNLNGFLAPEGLIDPGSIAGTLRESSSAHRLADLRGTFHELTSFALFTASLWLPREQELALSRRINQRLEAIRG